MWYKDLERQGEGSNVYPHLPRALWADKRIYRANLPNKSSPIFPRLFRRFVWLQDAGYPFINSVSS